jgi:antitoxin Phd
VPLLPGAPPLPRILQASLQASLTDTPVVLIQGPRQCGKTTLARTVAEPRGYGYINFDDDTVMITVTSMEAQNRFGQLLDTVQREPATITRHGRTAAFMVSPQDMEDLQTVRRKRGTAVEAFEAYFAKADATLIPAARKLPGDDVVRLVKESR